MTTTDIYFSGDDAHAFLPWVIGIMACIATLLLCIGVTVGSWVIDRSGSYSNSFTVNIPATADDIPAKVDTVKKVLDTVPGIKRITQVQDAALREMLKPWLGNAEALGALPLPVVFDITTASDARIDYPALQAKLAKIAPGTEIDSHEHWVENFSRFSATLRAIMTLLASCIVAGLALMIAFSSRASLKLHARTVNLLHSIGAEDNYIMRQFQLEAFMVTLRGTLPGCILAALGYWAAGFYITRLQSSLFPGMDITGAHIALFILMPLTCGAIAWITARISVIKQLQRVL